VCQFAEELLRIFIALLLRINGSFRIADSPREEKQGIEKYEGGAACGTTQILKDLGSGVVDEEEIKRAMDELEKFDFEAIWEEDDHSELTQFGRRGKSNT